MHAHRHQSRQGMAIVIAVASLSLLIGLALTLTDTSISSSQEATRRRDDLNLTLGTESLASLAFAYLKTNSDLTTMLGALKTATPTSDELLYTGYTSSGARTAKDSALVAAATQTIGNLQVSNGLDARISWAYLSTISVPINNVTSNQDIFRVTATGALNGPAYLYPGGSRQPIANPNSFRRRRIELLFTPVPVKYFQQAMWAKKSYDFMGAATTDSWNSNNGAVTYAAGTKGSQGDLTSNGTIYVQKPSNVQGTASTVNIPVPTITYNPSGSVTNLPTSGSPGLLASTTSPLATGKYRCSALKLASNNAITFAANAEVTIYVDSYIEIRKDWDFRACGNPRTVIIIQNNYDSSLGDTNINGNIVVGNPDNPRAFQFYSLYDGELPTPASPGNVDFTMNGTAQFGGVILAPYSTFKLNGGMDFYGAVMADSFADNTGTGKVNGSFDMHYDESLADLETPFPPSLIVVGWRSYDVPPAQTRADGTSWDAQ